MKLDPQAARHGLVRVVDESGEDYLYPEQLFVAIALPRGAGRAFRAASEQAASAAEQRGVGEPIRSDRERRSRLNDRPLDGYRWV